MVFDVLMMAGQGRPGFCPFFRGSAKYLLSGMVLGAALMGGTALADGAAPQATPPVKAAPAAGTPTGRQALSPGGAAAGKTAASSPAVAPSGQPPAPAPVSSPTGQTASPAEQVKAHQPVAGDTPDRAASSAGAAAPAASEGGIPPADTPAPASSGKTTSSRKGTPARGHANILTIPLPADESVGRQDVDYTCSIDEKKAGDEVRSLRTSLPAGRFTVTYLTADIMALAVLPVDGRVMVFANVVAGDGAKYVGDRYGWWAKGDDVTFSREDHNNVSLACHVVPVSPPPSSSSRK